jgi:leucyl/phenylalanyl-tRNA--protein transferase
MKNITWLRSDDPPDRFPDADEALEDPHGLLAVGGDLSEARLLAAYRRGIFPWYSSGQPILWWSPDPRAVLLPRELKISRSLAKRLRSGALLTAVDTDFSATIAGCAAPRPNARGTWITADMRRAYQDLHAKGFAHSVETWLNGQLVGGLYGVALGGVFYGESMFSRAADASKVALCRLVQECQARDIAVIDCQMPTAHLASLGVKPIARRDFLQLLDQHCRIAAAGSWRQNDRPG